MYQRTKRAFDLIVATIGLVILSPVLLIVALIVRIALGSPVLFRQERSGLNGRTFQLRKFRTMTEGRDEQGELLPDADRLGPVGRFMRATSLDELPQLINVVRGEMSLVGPRPLLPEYDQLYSPTQARRLLVKPGITGLAQVRGRNALEWDDKLALDVEYVDDPSFGLDMRILAETVLVVLGRKGISQSGEVTAARFTGPRQSEGKSTE